MKDFLINFFDHQDFMPRWVCGHWTELHGWLYILSNIAVWAAYFTIPLILIYVINKRQGFVFRKVFIWFILFIFLCGTTHLVDAIIFWFPIYRVNALILFTTAVVSWVTVYILYKYLPEVLEYKSPEELQKIIDNQAKELLITNKHLAESEKQFRALVNHNPDIITRINKNRTYTFINESLNRIRGVDVNQIIGKSIYELRDPKDTVNNEIFIKALDSVFETKKSLSYEFTSHTLTSSKCFFSINLIPLQNNENDEIEDILTVTKDITVQKMNELSLQEHVANLQLLAEKLENKRRILEDFTYIVSHNLRSPVANLAALINLIQEDNQGDMRDILLQKLFIAFEKLSTTVYDLTTVVQIRNEIQIEKELLFFNKMLENQIINLETQIKEADAEIEYDFSDCESIAYPRIYLESIFLNMLTNALKYRSEERKTKIIFKSFIDFNGVISFTCEDNGLGIDMQKHGYKLFGLNKTFHNHPDAKGFGLFITKNQIESLGGSISAHSEVNHGTIFTIIFNKFIS